MDQHNMESIVAQAGLSANEAVAYSKLLLGGEMSITALARDADIKRPNMYSIISSLQDIGLVSKTQKGKRFVYSAVHPRRLLQIASFKKSQIEDNLPRLVGAYQHAGEKPKIQMFEGMQAVRAIYRECLERLVHREELLIFTNIGRVMVRFPEIPKEFKKVVGSVVYRSRVRELVCGDDAGVAYAESMQTHTGNGYQVRAAQTDSAFGDNEQFIFHDKIIYFSLQKEIFVIIIENEDLAWTHRALFDMAWDQAG